MFNRICFIFLITNWYLKTMLPHLMQFFLILKRINHFMDLWTGSKDLHNLYCRVEARRLKMKLKVLLFASIILAVILSGAVIFTI